MTEPLAPRSAPVDPWGHEVGDDVGHLLDAAGHVPHQAEQMGHLIGAPQPIKVKKALDPKVAYGILLAAGVATAGVIAVAVL